MQYKPISLHYKQKHITMKKQMKQIALPLFLGGLIACSPKTAVNETDLLGNWTEILLPSSNFVQGMTLAKEGKASSIGMATLQYESWQLLSEGQLVLSGKSIGNGQTISFSDTLAILSLQQDTLTLRKGADYQIKYVRQPESAPLVGTDKASTGYTWSDVLQKDIRIFETGQKVLSSTDSLATQAGFLVFATDSSKVEVFLPDTKVILDRRVRPDGIAVWNVEDDDTYQVQACADSWIVSRRGRLLYSTYGTDKKIETSFLTAENTEIPVAFYPHEALAEVCLDGQYMLLSQYRTASGYGYKNTILDLRGKGKEATLTRSTDGKTFQLTEKN